MKYEFLDEFGSFQMEGAENDLGLYFPIAGENGYKGAITPNLSGDAKLDQNHFLLEPVSVENLNNNRSSRNFWVITEDGKTWSATGASAMQEAERFTEEQDDSYVKAGLMWHEAGRASRKIGIQSKIINFVGIHTNVEIMQVEITNTGKKAKNVTAVAAIPIYGRSADNIRDHRHVTSLLHRIKVEESGVLVAPTMSFDERGHQKGDMTYYVEGVDTKGNGPVCCFPVLDDFLGMAGTLTRPEKIQAIARMMEEGKSVESIRSLGVTSSDPEIQGEEALGGLVFAPVTIDAGETYKYIVLMGMGTKEEAGEVLSTFGTPDKIEKQLEETKKYWLQKRNAKYHTGNNSFDQFMNWVSFQPQLRRIFGCSFLPHHDYGKGGRGWRDLWQDCLALLLMNPEQVRKMLVANYEGVRMDGTNATIIGDRLGEFKADRNSITRVWSDHGLWPFITTKLYMDQTGDMDILTEEVAYFKDRQVGRGKVVDEKWTPDVKNQEDGNGNVVKGTVLEHILLENLSSYFEVGDHGHLALRDADWNDALDMARVKGETVAFTCALVMNLLDIADVLEKQMKRGVLESKLLKEFAEILVLHNLQADTLADQIAEKRVVLASYLELTKHTVSGEYVLVRNEDIIKSLRAKAAELTANIKASEWVGDDKGNHWFNSYYDDHGRQVEGNDRMMLTGQVFAIMSGVASVEEVESITRAADSYLYDEACGGYRLNTDFHEVKMDMGRMFGFGYGEKENGAVFSHMAVMYANALYKRGFAKEGYKALNALFKQAMNVDVSRIYPGVPEYFGKNGRGLYHYLTGAASWYMLTVMTRMFGVRGLEGNLEVAPMLMAEQFDDKGQASIGLTFGGIQWEITIENPKGLEFEQYVIDMVTLDGEECPVEKTLDERTGCSIRIHKDVISKLDAEVTHELKLILK